VIQVGNYFEERVGSLGSETKLVHEQHIVEEDDDDEEEGITIDTTGTDSDDSDTDDGGSSTGGDNISSGGTSAFACPQCQRELKGTTCKCGFEFDASDVQNGTISVEGATIEELLDKFGLDKPDRPSVRPHPVMGTIDADNKPDLIDQLERDIGIEWEIHEAEITVKGTLTTDDLEAYGISADALDNRVTIDETFEFTPEEPLSRQSFLSLVWDLSVPEKATLSVSLQVDKNE
jgi:hypothetical protein